MITPDEQIPLDDANGSDKEDQMSQADIHSNGLDEENEPTEANGTGDAHRLKRASDASGPSFTLNTDG